MPRQYWQPRHVREELAAKKNPRVRRKRNKKSLAGKKVMWDRYLRARKELWDVVLGIVCETDYLRREGETNKRSFALAWGTGCLPFAQKKVAELEKEMEARGL